MPTYTYVCTGCGHHFDLFHSMSDNSVKSCPECGEVAKRWIGAGVGLIFKGSGFYITDYKNGHSSMPSNGEGSNGHKGDHGSNGGSSAGTTEKSAEKKSESVEAKATSTPPAATS